MTTAEALTVEIPTKKDSPRDAGLRDEIRALVNRLPAYDLHNVRRYVEFLVHESQHPAYVAADNAPYDDEPLTDEDLEDLRVSDEDIRMGRLIPQEELEKELQLDLAKT
ncbi:MAG: hypothetical protein O3A46_00730 [Candidatus Poribacteria bacterium]|nr:hypothetical protein [Candidatus Poribacteria bacterium]